MKNANEIIKSVMQGLASTMLNKDPREWPPTCTIFVYQPQRPAIQKDETNTESK